ncbi:MAG TPA: inner membrane-spanning protein YciB [Steroidobacteraceae bacterium]|nr:inner membrane-spanning protein YciB [Steroidobacteraceae bacterium]
MQALLELAPLIAFFVAYRVWGLYVATAVLMGGMLVLVITDYLRLRRIPAMHGLSTVLVLVFGTATLVLHNLRFIQWKPTVFFWLASLAFLASFWLGKQTLTQRLLGAALAGEDSKVSQGTWKRLNTLWVLFYALLGALNLLVAFNFSEHAWVDFKVIGLPVVNFLFAGAQIAWLMRRAPSGSGEPSPQA